MKKLKRIEAEAINLIRGDIINGIHAAMCIEDKNLKNKLIALFDIAGELLKQYELTSDGKKFKKIENNGNKN